MLDAPLRPPNPHAVSSLEYNYTGSGQAGVFSCTITHTHAQKHTIGTHQYCCPFPLARKLFVQQSAHTATLSVLTVQPKQLFIRMLETSILRINPRRRRSVNPQHAPLKLEYSTLSFSDGKDGVEVAEK